MNKDDYVEILTRDLIGSLEYYGYGKGSFIFQHDNDPKHTAGVTKSYLTGADIETLPWPSQSPDLNPIENIWNYLKVQIGSQERRPSSIHELWQVVLQEWEKVPLDLIKSLYESMPRRVEAVVRAKGGHTKY
jgi:hypothetical protein